MIKKYASLFILVFIAAFAEVNAQDAPVVTFNIPYQNNLKYNRFLFNPAFSFVREDNTYVSLYHRNQWVQFDDSPKVYMLTYTGRFSDKSGLGFGLFQQNIGVITSFGGVANYSYNVKFKERMNLTVGFNIAYYNSGVNKSRTVTGEPDPLIMELGNNSLLSIKPGINFNYKDFDLGVYAENVIDYDFKSDGMAKEYTDKTYSAHLMYTHKMVTLKDLFQDSDFTLGIRGRMSEEYGFALNGSLVVNFPRLGWVQTSIDDFYGIGIGAGFHFTKRLSLGYTYERTVKDGLVNLGPTHEIVMAFKLKDKISIRERNKAANDTLALLDEEVRDSIAAEKAVAKQKDTADSDFASDAEIEKLRMELDEDSQYLLDALIKEDSIAKLQKSDFERKMKNLKEYAQREKEAKELRAKTETLNLKRLDPGEEALEDPQTVEDLKKARSGYYVVSKPANSKNDKEVLIERHETFTEAANALEKKKAEGKEKNPYLVHVEDTSESEIEVLKKTEKENEAKNRNTGEGSQSKSVSQKNNKNQSTKPKTNQNVQEPSKTSNVAVSKPATPAATTPPTKIKSAEDLSTEQEIKEYFSAKTDKIRQTPKRENALLIKDVEPGYYVIANVFSEQENTDKFLKKMKDRGVQADYFMNPANGFRYVYLKKHSSWREALISYYSNVNNTYFETVWLMSINVN